MRTAAAVLSIAGATWCLDALLATFGDAEPAGQGPGRVLLGLATVGCLVLVYRFLEGSRAADERALDEHRSAAE